MEWEGECDQFNRQMQQPSLAEYTEVFSPTELRADRCTYQSLSSDVTRITSVVHGTLLTLISTTGETAKRRDVASHVNAELFRW